jgi:hypothetical protein
MPSEGTESKDYYEKGSTQISQVTAVALKKLAQVSLMFDVADFIKSIKPQKNVSV